MLAMYPPSFWIQKYSPSQLYHIIQIKIAKLVEDVTAWQQDLKYIEYRLEDFSQGLVARQTNIKVVCN
jgi:hypothetical protein